MTTVPIHFKAHWLTVILIWFIGLICIVVASHFRGATIQWRPVNSDGSAFNGEVSRAICLSIGN